MEFSVEVEKPSSVIRKLTVKVPAKEVNHSYHNELVAIQKRAHLKGFRQGHAPISIVKKYFGDDVRHQILHRLIDESFQQAVRQEQLNAIGRAQIDTPKNKTGEGDHDHAIHEDQDLTYTATFEVIPEVEVQNYTGIALNQDKVEVTDEQVEKVIQELRKSQSQLIPISSKITEENGTELSRPVQNGDFVDATFTGGVVTESGIQPREDMKGTRLIEVGGKGWVPGFEDQLIGMIPGQSKTFRIGFPQDYEVTDLAGKEAEYTVTVHEIKERKLPELDAEFAKQFHYETIEDFKKGARDSLVRSKTQESSQKVKQDLLSLLIARNPFEVPNSLIQAQAEELAHNLFQELKNRGLEDRVIQGLIGKEQDELMKRAESQVRASLILEAISAKENIKIESEEIEQEIQRLAAEMKVDPKTLENYYASNSGRKADLEFRLRQERTLKFLLDKSEIKEVEANEK